MLQLGRQDVADGYELLLSYLPNLELESVSSELLLDAAAWRARCRLRTPDAILLAPGMRSDTTAAVRTIIAGVYRPRKVLKPSCLRSYRVDTSYDPREPLSINNVKYHL